MQKRIRNNIFETNSSAVHCLVMPKAYYQNSNLNITNNNIIKTHFFNDFSGNTISSQDEKLSYLITQIYYKNCGLHTHSIEEDSEYQFVKECVCEYTGADDIEIDYSVEPEINHQASWDNHWGNVFIETYDKDSVISFIFSPIMVKEFYD